jgi:asparagine synthase (glutamine-hydrolysing)
VALTFNGEIYNYLELRDDLQAQGHRFRTHSDSEVLLHSYLQWGTDCVSRLNGMFAFAIWDGRSNHLFAARDRFGEKPFYYRHTPGGFHFASEIKALVQDRETPALADERAIVRYLALAQVDGEATTFFRDIRQLPAAHWLLLKNDQAEVRRYWRLTAEQDSTTTDAEHVDNFRSLFFDSVRLRLRSDVAVGTGLSGGLDSSSVVGAVRALRPADAPFQATFSARYDDQATDEGTFIEAVVARGGVRDHHVFLRPEEVPEDIDRLVWHQDEPFVSLSMYAQHKVMQLARTAGVTVLLDGQGADEYLAGYHPPAFGGRFASLARQGQWGRLVSEMDGYRRHHQGTGRALRFLAGALLPGPLWTRLKAREEGATTMLRPGLFAYHRDTLNAPETTLFTSPLKRALHQQLTRTSLPSLLRFGDRNSMAFSRETRLPFLDHRLVELVTRMPEHMLVSAGVTKVVLRRAMAPDLPPSVVQRQDKLGFAPPQDQWLRGPLRGWFEELLASAAQSEFLVPGAVHERWRRFLVGRASLAPLWRIANLHLWRKRFSV